MRLLQSINLRIIFIYLLSSLPIILCAQKKAKLDSLYIFLNTAINLESWNIELSKKNEISITYLKNFDYYLYFPNLGFRFENKEPSIKCYHVKKEIGEFEIRITIKKKSYSIAKFQREEINRHIKILKENPKALLAKKVIIKKEDYFYILWNSLLDKSLINGYRVADEIIFKNQLEMITKLIADYFDNPPSLNRLKRTSSKLNLPLLREK